MVEQAKALARKAETLWQRGHRRWTALVRLSERVWHRVEEASPRTGEVGRFAFEVLSKYRKDDCTSYAASLSFWLLISLVPLTTLLFKLLGLVMGSQAYGKTLLTGLFELLPYLPVDFVRDAIQNSQKIGHLGFSWIVLVVGGLWGVNQLDTSLAHVFGIRVKRHRQTRRFFLLRRLCFVLGGMAILVVFLVLLAGGVVGHKLAIPRIASLGYLAPALGLLVVTQVLQHLPRCHVHFRHAFLGAFISSALWWVAQWAFGIYLAHTVTWGIMYGSLFKIIAGLIFLYYSCSIFLLGAEITAAFYRHDVTGAVAVPEDLKGSEDLRKAHP